MGKAIRRPPLRGGAERVGFMMLSLSLSLIYASLSSFCLRPWQIHKSWSIYPPSFPPRRSAHSARPAPRGGCQQPFFRSKFASFFGTDFWPIWGRLGSLLGGHFRPLGPPSSLKMASRGVLKAYLCQKRRFCSHTTFSNTKTAFWTPRQRPKQPKIGPRRLQDGLEEGLFRS